MMEYKNHLAEVEVDESLGLRHGGLPAVTSANTGR